MKSNTRLQFLFTSLLISFSLPYSICTISGSNTPPSQNDDRKEERQYIPDIGQNIDQEDNISDMSRADNDQTPKGDITDDEDNNVQMNQPPSGRSIQTTTDSEWDKISPLANKRFTLSSLPKGGSLDDDLNDDNHQTPNHTGNIANELFKQFNDPQSQPQTHQNGISHKEQHPSLDMLPEDIAETNEQHDDNQNLIETTINTQNLLKQDSSSSKEDQQQDDTNTSNNVEKSEQQTTSQLFTTVTNPHIADTQVNADHTQPDPMTNEQEDNETEESDNPESIETGNNLIPHHLNVDNNGTENTVLNDTQQLGASISQHQSQQSSSSSKEDQQQDDDDQIATDSDNDIINSLKNMGPNGTPHNDPQQLTDVSSTSRRLLGALNENALKLTGGACAIALLYILYTSLFKKSAFKKKEDIGSKLSVRS